MPRANAYDEDVAIAVDLVDHQVRPDRVDTDRGIDLLTQPRSLMLSNSLKKSAREVLTWLQNRQFKERQFCPGRMKSTPKPLVLRHLRQ